MRAALCDWAQQHEFLGLAGEPLFLTQKSITIEFNKWLNDSVDDDLRRGLSAARQTARHSRHAGCPAHARDTDQLHRGDRYGLQKSWGGRTQNAATWNVSAYTPIS